VGPVVLQRHFFACSPGLISSVSASPITHTPFTVVSSKRQPTEQYPDGHGELLAVLSNLYRNSSYSSPIPVIHLHRRACLTPLPPRNS